jgi:hypothetical protein
MRTNLGTWTTEDNYRYPMFELWERKFNLTTGRIEETPMNLLGDYDFVYFCARRSDNVEDADDHTKDNIYRALNIDSGPFCHYAWQDTDLITPGKYIVKLYFIRKDGKKFHSQALWEFEVVRKMPGTYANY